MVQRGKGSTLRAMPEYVTLRAPAEHSNPINMDLFPRLLNRIRLLCVWLADRLQVAAICRIASKARSFVMSHLILPAGEIIAGNCLLERCYYCYSIEIFNGTGEVAIGDTSLI
jgi:hypothetical protein